MGRLLARLLPRQPPTPRRSPSSLACTFPPHGLQPHSPLASSFHYAMPPFHHPLRASSRWDGPADEADRSAAPSSGSAARHGTGASAVVIKGLNEGLCMDVQAGYMSIHEVSVRDEFGDVVIRVHNEDAEQVSSKETELKVDSEANMEVLALNEDQSTWIEADECSDVSGDEGYMSIGEASVSNKFGDVVIRVHNEDAEQVSPKETELKTDSDADVEALALNEDQNTWIEANECSDASGDEGVSDVVIKGLNEGLCMALNEKQITWIEADECSDASVDEDFMLELFEIDDSLEATEVVKKSEFGKCHHLLTLDEAKEVLDSVRARDVCVLDVGDRCEWTSTMVFATGISDRHVRGIADALIFKIKKKPYIDPSQYPTVEGGDKGKWLLVDCGSIVIHVFSEEARAFYKLEEFWNGKKKFGDADQGLEKIFKLGRLKPSTRSVKS